MEMSPSCTNVDPEIFFDPARTAQALDICSACPVAKRCGQAEDEHGVWGGEVRVTVSSREDSSTTHRLVAWPTDPEHVRALSMLRDGYTTIEVGEAMGQSFQWVMRVVWQYTADGSARASLEERALEMAIDGKKLAVIADELDVSVRTVRRMVGTEGRAAFAAAREKRVLELRAGGLLQQEIADKIGTSRTVVGRIIKQAAA